MSTPLRTGKCESSAVEWASAPSATKYGQAAHNARHMIEWGQYPFNNKETLTRDSPGITELPPQLEHGRRPSWNGHFPTLLSLGLIFRNHDLVYVHLAHEFVLSFHFSTNQTSSNLSRSYSLSGSRI